MIEILVDAIKKKHSMFVETKRKILDDMERVALNISGLLQVILLNFIF